MKKDNKKPSPISKRVMLVIEAFDPAEVKGEASLGDNVFWKKGDGFYWKRYVGIDKPLENISLVELNDTFGY